MDPRYAKVVAVLLALALLLLILVLLGADVTVFDGKD